MHGDFGFGNLLVHGRGITGVLDWADACLGDPLYDIAHLTFRAERIPYAALWREHAASVGYDVSHFAQRLSCYLLHIGLTGMIATAHRGDEKAYVWIRERTWSLLRPHAA